jgi:cytochrome c-type biogenesis protein CcmE
MKNILKYIIAFAVVAVALGYFMVTSVTGEKLYYKEVSDLVNNPESSETRGLRVSGNVVEGKFDVSKTDRYAHFEVADVEGARMNVVYSGSVPDALEIGTGVILEGTYDATSNTFNAQKLLTKCPSKYEADLEEGGEHPEDVPMSSEA